jgi:hypothetical protein
MHTTLAAPAKPQLTLDSILRLPRAELEAMYRRADAGPMPDGESFGKASSFPGMASGELTEAVYGLFWQGKVFKRDEGMLVNKILGLFRDVPARIFSGDSWFDGRPSILIDYRETSWLCRPVRDEIREVAPGLYLGLAYVRMPWGKPVTPLMFALEFPR